MWLLITKFSKDFFVQISTPKYLRIRNFLNFPANHTINGDTISWNIPIVDGLSAESWIIEFEVLPSTPLSSFLYFESSIIDDYGDFNGTAVNTNNFYYRNIIVQGSYDPNDKQVFPDGEVTYGVQDFEYFIRFQNTGTDTAFTVVVKDILPAELDVMTFEMCHTSHDFDLTIENNRTLVWTFNNILLPDSTTNEPASHGFIRFKIGTTEPLYPFEKVENSAAIYFDFNEPIITNTAQNCIVKETIYTTDGIELCPGDYFNDQPWFSDTVFSDTTEFPLYDSIFLFSINVLPEYQIIIDTVAFEYVHNGISITADTTFQELFTATNACDSLVIFNIQIVTSTVEQIVSTLEVFPNPTNDFVVIKYPQNSGKESRLEIRNVFGQLIEEKMIGAGKERFRVDLGDKPAGLYFFYLYLEEKIHSTKVVKD